MRRVVALLGTHLDAGRRQPQGHDEGLEQARQQLLGVGGRFHPRGHLGDHRVRFVALAVEEAVHEALDPAAGRGEAERGAQGGEHRPRAAHALPRQRDHPDGRAVDGGDERGQQDVDEGAVEHDVDAVDLVAQYDGRDHQQLDERSDRGDQITGGHRDDDRSDHDADQVDHGQPPQHLTLLPRGPQPPQHDGERGEHQAAGEQRHLHPLRQQGADADRLGAEGVGEPAESVGIGAVGQRERADHAPEQSDRAQPDAHDRQPTHAAPGQATGREGGPDQGEGQRLGRRPPARRPQGDRRPRQPVALWSATGRTSRFRPRPARARAPPRARASRSAPRAAERPGTSRGPRTRPRSRPGYARRWAASARCGG